MKTYLARYSYQPRVVQNLISPVLARSNPHGQHKQLSHNVEVKPQHLRSPDLANAKINNLRHLFLSANSAYALSVLTHSELALAGYKVKGAYSPLRAFFMRILSMQSHVMAKLEGDTFACAGILLHQSANPFQLCRLHLAVNGRASFQVKGVHSHA